MNYYWPIIMVVGLSICYHICAKSIPGSANPLAFLGISYMVSAVAAFILYFLTSPARSLVTEYKNLNWTAFVLGIAVVGLEFGNINMYRVGWDISIGSLVTNIALAVILVLIGILIYKEAMTIQKVAGIGFCLVGLFLINK